MGSASTRVNQLFRQYVLWRFLSDEAIAAYLSPWAWLVLRAHRPMIVGVTGSAGKTTTTGMIASVLSHPLAQPVVGRVGHSRDNQNDDIGVPISILRLEKIEFGAWRRVRYVLHATAHAIRLTLSRDYPQVLVLEMGTHWRGHLHRIAQLAPPDIGVVTTIGPAHLERLKSIDGVVEEKSAIVRWTRPSGLVVLGTDHNRVEQLKRYARAPVVTVEGRGLTSAQNIARAVARHLGVPDAAIEEGLADFELPRSRLNRIELGGITIVDDSFNANPTSMKLGLDLIAETAGPGRRTVAVLGAMAELGEESARYHREVGDHARRCCDLVIAVGEPARDYRADYWFATSGACADRIRDLIRPGDCLLVKGSKAAKMGAIVERLRELPEPQSQAAEFRPPAAGGRRRSPRS